MGEAVDVDDQDLGVDDALALVREAHPAPGLSGPATVPAPASTPGQQGDRPHGTPWPEARSRAEAAGRAAGRAAAKAPRNAAAPAAHAPHAPHAAPTAVALDQALGLVLAAPLVALTDLPSFDTSAMDGWAVAGPGPWTVRAEGVLAGHALPDPLADGEAVRIATGARVPQEATAVLRSEHGRIDARSRLHARREVVHGQDIRPRGQECRSGDLLLPPRTPVTPAVLGLAAAAGYDALPVFPRPRVDILVLGDELLTDGLPRDGLIRDALGPMLPSWLRALGAEVTDVHRLGDDAQALRQAIAKSDADLVITTGGTAAGPVDHVHPTLRALGAELLVDGVQVRPGHPMLLAQLSENQHLVGLPGNPLAAVSGLLTLAEPLIRTLSGGLAPEPLRAPASDDVQGHPYDTRLVPVTLRANGVVGAAGAAGGAGAGASGADEAVPLRFNGPAMLRGIAVADGLAVVPPGGASRGRELEILDLPWGTW
nr:molybdopterin molybdotransferase MoeA [Streptomyces apocyni]